MKLKEALEALESLKRQISVLQNQCDAMAAQRDSARAEVKRLTDQAAEDARKLANFQDTNQFVLKTNAELQRNIGRLEDWVLILMYALADAQARIEELVHEKS